MAEMVSVKGGKFHRLKNPVVECSTAFKPQEMLCGLLLEPFNYFETVQDAARYTGNRLHIFACKHCESRWANAQPSR